MGRRGDGLDAALELELDWSGAGARTGADAGAISSFIQKSNQIKIFTPPRPQGFQEIPQNEGENGGWFFPAQKKVAEMGKTHLLGERKVASISHLSQNQAGNKARGWYQRWRRW